MVRSASRNSRPGALGYAVSALLDRTRAVAHDITIDGAKMHPGPLAGAIALNTLHLSRHRPCKGARPDDAMLDLLLQPAGFLAEKLAEVTMFAGAHAVGTEHHRFRRLRIVPPDPAALYLDGEIGRRRG